jgi:hypothetical protein
VVTVGPLATTHMARATRYSIVAGRLQLIHVEDGTPRPLTFERR